MTAVARALRNRFGVWMLLESGERWNYCNERTLDEALRTARTLRGDLSLFPKHPVWIAPPAKIGVDREPR